jgi:Domain of unknown function (DUF4783)
MKSLFFFFICPMLWFGLPTDAPFNAVENAFSSSDAPKIVAYSKEKILMSVLGKEGAYSTSQATLILKDFFVKKPVTSFKFAIKGKDTAEGSYAIGTYTTKTEVFRVGVNFKKFGDSYKIDNISIEKS